MATHWAKVKLGIKDRDVPKSKKDIFCIITPVSTFIFTRIIITKKKTSFNYYFQLMAKMGTGKGLIAPAKPFQAALLSTKKGQRNCPFFISISSAD